MPDFGRELDLYLLRQALDALETNHIPNSLRLTAQWAIAERYNDMPTKKDALYSSVIDNWATPDYIFKPLNEFFGFNLDIAAEKGNAKCPNFLTRIQKFSPHQMCRYTCWLNPPYGKDIHLFMQYASAFNNAKYGSRVGFPGQCVCLVPARTDTKWWQEYAKDATFIVFLKGRIRFVHPQLKKSTSAPFPSALIVYGGCYGKEWLNRWLNAPVLPGLIMVNAT